MSISNASSHHILIVGFGDIGAPVAQAFAAAGSRVTVLSRSVRDSAAGIEHRCCDVANAESVAAALAGIKPDLALICLSPDSFTQEAYESVFVRGVENFLAACPSTLQRIFFVSSTSVYGQLHGEWVDEESAIEPAGFSGRSLYRAETLLRTSAIASVAVRFAGIYGRGSNRLLSRALRGDYASRDDDSGPGGQASSPFTNRIHREDCIASLIFLMQAAGAGAPLHDCYLAADNTPVTQLELQAWLQAEYRRCHGSLPKSDNRPDSQAALASTARRVGSKRCSNQRLRDAGYTLLYPDYRAGYGEIIAAMGRTNSPKGSE